MISQTEFYCFSTALLRYLNSNFRAEPEVKSTTTISLIPVMKTSLAICHSH
jgi:hypothetical protein